MSAILILFLGLFCFGIVFSLALGKAAKMGDRIMAEAFKNLPAVPVPDESPKGEVRGGTCEPDSLRRHRKVAGYPRGGRHSLLTLNPRMIL